MTITPTTGPIDPRQVREAATAAKLGAATTPPEPREAAGETATERDQMDVTRDAATLQHEMTVAQAALDALPATRAERIAAARERLARGEYDKPEVLDRIADNMLPQLLAREEGEGDTAGEPVPARDARIAAKRLATGYYEQPAVQNKISERLVDDVLRKLTGREKST